MAIDLYMLRLALRENFGRLKKELIGHSSIEEQRRLLSKIPDIEIAIGAVQKIIEKDETFDRYPLAIRVLRSICNAASNRLDARTNKNLDDVCFRLKMLHLLSKIGHQAAEGVMELLNDYFPNADGGQDLADKISGAVYSELRLYVLQILLQNKRSVHFANNKFPDKSDAARPKAMKVFGKVRQTLSANLDPPELSMPLQDLPERAQLDPAVCFYYERFGGKNGEKGVSPSEDDLIDFVRQLRESQLSVATPAEIVFQTPASEDSDDSVLSEAPTEIMDSESRRRSTRRRRGPGTSDQNSQSLTDSGDLFVSPASKRRRRVYQISSYVSNDGPSENDIEMIDLKKAGIGHVYGPDGKRTTLKANEVYHCVVRIEPIDLKETRFKRILDSDGKRDFPK